MCFLIIKLMNISIQNEKEEALTTSVWIEMVTKHKPLLMDFIAALMIIFTSLYATVYLQDLVKSQTPNHFCFCSNGVTTG